jgi:hypothetical protein
MCRESENDVIRSGAPLEPQAFNFQPIIRHALDKMAKRLAGDFISCIRESSNTSDIKWIKANDARLITLQLRAPRTLSWPNASFPIPN